MDPPRFSDAAGACLSPAIPYPPPEFIAGSSGPAELTDPASQRLAWEPRSESVTSRCEGLAHPRKADSTAGRRKSHQAAALRTRTLLERRRCANIGVVETASVDARQAQVPLRLGSLTINQSPWLPGLQHPAGMLETASTTVASAVPDEEAAATRAAALKQRTLNPLAPAPAPAPGRHSSVGCRPPRHPGGAGKRWSR